MKCCRLLLLLCFNDNFSDKTLPIAQAIDEVKLTVLFGDLLAYKWVHTPYQQRCADMYCDEDNQSYGECLFHTCVLLCYRAAFVDKGYSFFVCVQK